MKSTNTRNPKTALNHKVDAYLDRAARWQAEMRALRSLVLEAGLNEEFKWGKPCYTFDGKNVVLIVGFKPHCALLFSKGALLKDPSEILIKPGEDTQAARQVRFTSAASIAHLASALKRYLHAAIAVEKAGLEVPLKRISERNVPEELVSKLNELPDLKKAWAVLTPGRQRAYLMHIAGSKQQKTRESRVQKCLPQILAGKGLNEDWKARKAAATG